MKKVLYSIILALVLITLTGCDKSAISKEKFKSVMESNNYKVNDLTDGYSYVDTVYFASDKENNTSIFFYEFQKQNTNNSESKDYASEEYEKFIVEIKEHATSSSTEENTDENGLKKYILRTDDNYYVIAKINNTLIYAETTSTKKIEVENLLKLLGY